MNAGSDSDLARRLRRDGVCLGELFSFVSGLYFRGKLAYARAFATPPSGLSGSLVITANAGLLQPDTVVTIEQLRAWAGNDIAADNRRYRAALDRDCGLLLGKIGESCDIVLLGSIATAKYVDPLLEVFREQLLIPAEFVGRGDMSRGGLLLRSVEVGKELTYRPVIHSIRHGKRPAKLAPMPGRRDKSVHSDGRAPRPE